MAMIEAWWGIDPGKTGGVACLAWHPEAHRLELRHLEPMPKAGPYVSARGLQLLLRRLAYPGELYDERVRICIEKVHGIGRQSAAMSFKFGAAFGVAVAAAELTLGAPLLVTPQAWHKTTQTALGQGKQASIARAREIVNGGAVYADTRELREKLRKDGMAEAMLIALHGATVYGGQAVNLPPPKTYTIEELM